MRQILAFAIGVVVLTLAIDASAQPPERPERADGPRRPERQIQWVDPEIAKVPGLQHKVLASESLGHDVGYAVWVPAGYEQSQEARYPVVYFLHGAGGTEASDSGGFSSLVASAIRRGKFPQAICVFPNGGLSGYRGPVEAMIIDELIPLIDKEFRTKADATGRAVAGFSMGGAGAVHLSISHPNLFCAAGSLGGALSRRGSGEDSPLLPAAIAAAETLKQNHFALLTVNGDQDHPEGFAPLKKTLDSIGISHQVVTLESTSHNLSQYYDRAGETMTTFLGQQLSGGQSSPESP
ncbi:esterase family protein [Roseiconus nitratireducens]|uniref:Esterase family protein n=1 Tax=Roseiconus nitratireducens TaxID=2605748 RepID=A0A5M6D782_9BACT|nr:alpha/beta hydrolase-fold protein [Roseiconus nitratireducens]KAA5542132.1 esterase family protein [Roseiconus nitratireducens]